MVPTGPGLNWNGVTSEDSDQKYDPFADFFAPKTSPQVSIPARRVSHTEVPSKAVPSTTSGKISDLSSSNPFDVFLGSSMSVDPSHATTPRGSSVSPCQSSFQGDHISVLEKLRSQVASLQSQLDAAKLSPTLPANGPPSIAFVLERAAINDYAPMHSCRSLFRKRMLIAGALNTENSDIILEVTIFMFETLKEHLFLQILKDHPVALDAFLSHLESVRNSSVLIRIYTALNRLDNAALHMLNIATSHKDANSRLAAIADCQRFIEAHNTQSKGPELTFLCKHIADLHSLLKRQISIEEWDLQLAENGTNQIWLTHPRWNVIGLPVINLLRYCLTYHGNAQKGKLSHAKGIRDAFQIGKKTYTWIALRARAQVGDWLGVNALVKKTTFTRKSKCIIGFRAFVEVYAEFGGPKADMIKYAAMIENLEERYEICMNHQLFEIAAQALLTLKGEGRLETMKDTINRMTLPEEEKARIMTMINGVIAGSNKTK